MPLAGKCIRCGGNVIPTVHEGSVKKYLEVSRAICEKYKVSEHEAAGNGPRSGNWFTFGHEKGPLKALGLQISCEGSERSSYATGYSIFREIGSIL